MGKSKLIPIINYKKCVACRSCIQSCPFSCLDATKIGIDKFNKAFPELDESRNCTGCGICEKNCPIGIITMQEI